MNPQLLASGIFLLLFLAIIVAAHFMYRAQVDTEKSRKFVHVTGGILSLFLPKFIYYHWYVFGICLLAFLTLLITWIRKDLPGIHKTKRKSVGSVIFPVSIYACFYAYYFFAYGPFFYVPVLLLTFSDTAAELGGRKWGKYTASFFKGRKTLAGSLCFFASAVLIMLLFGGFYYSPHWVLDPIVLFLLFAIAIVATIAEAVSMNGLDNLTVPLAVLSTMIWFFVIDVF